MRLRQGDVLIETVDAIAQGAECRESPILVYSEATGHSHRVESLARAEV